MSTNANTCVYCFDNAHEYINCTHGHYVCKSCVNGVNNAIGQHKVFACADQSGCAGKYTYTNLFKFVEDKHTQRAYVYSRGFLNVKLRKP